MENLATIYTELVEAGRRGDAVEFFMAKVVGLPAEFVAGARNSPGWPAQEALAANARLRRHGHGRRLGAGRAGGLRHHPTLVMAGGASPAWMRQTAHDIAEILPDGQVIPWTVKITAWPRRQWPLFVRLLRRAGSSAKSGIVRFVRR